MSMAVIYIRDIGILLISIGAVIILTSLTSIIIPQIIDLNKRKQIMKKLNAKTSTAYSEGSEQRNILMTEDQDKVTESDNVEITVSDSDRTMISNEKTDLG